MALQLLEEVIDAVCLNFPAMPADGVERNGFLEMDGRCSSDWVLYISMRLWRPVFLQRLVLSGWRLSMRPVQPWTLAKAKQLGSEPDPWDHFVNLPLYVLGGNEDPRNIHKASHAMAGVGLLLSVWLWTLCFPWVSLGRKDSF